MNMKKYNIINNSLGWLCFVIASVTYLVTMEPTASFWDCPEFISQGFKLEVGHPPGNPIFMLAARFFVNFAGGDVSNVAIAVNAMSALLSAATILLLFWTITHLVRRLIVKDDAKEFSLTQMMLIFGSGLVGALAYTWSDTFWFSATEGEVYAFSSFCTALVFWLILKWENRADQPQSDRYLILIAYVIGISIGVHLLNLLCIPAIVLVVYYRKFKNTNVTGSLVALCVSAAIVGLILYGLVPGFIEMAQYFELVAVNGMGMSYNMGTLIYAIVLVAAFVWSIYELYAQKSDLRMKLSILVSVVLSGMFLIGDGLIIAALLTVALALYLFRFCKQLPLRIMSITMISMFVIFVGYSSYALLLIRSSANTPMNQNAPDNVFALSSYLNREQYGERPLFYGETFNSSVLYEVDGSGKPKAKVKEGPELYDKVVKTSPDEPDRYVSTGTKKSYEMIPELNMFFPRMYSSAHAAQYKQWIGISDSDMKRVDATLYVDTDGNPYQGFSEKKLKPTMLQNLDFFFTYQLNHMYWRYFMWNFAGRQNDVQGNGEVNHGNWITGISLLDDARLGDQSLLPDDLGKGNKGHNVFFMLPFLLGVIGLLWQAFVSKRGIEQFWVVFFLFFMTGIAIVLYLNQPPGQPRERDYAFAGSFYAYAIWIGLGVAGLYAMLKDFISKKSQESKVLAAVACVLGLFVPVQMVSQTWDDHDRSGRYTARDFGMNYLSSLKPNSVIFTNGDNDTFPLWYAQEVEDYRTDVRVVNLSYLTTDWYANQLLHPTYDAAAVNMQAKSSDYAHNRLQYSYILEGASKERVPVSQSLTALYAPESSKNDWNLPVIKYPNMYIPVDAAKAVENGWVSPAEADAIEEAIEVDMSGKDGLTLSNVISLDIIASSAANGWDRPVYFAMTVPDSYYLGLTPYMRNAGMAYEVTPVLGGDGYNVPCDLERMYDNVMNKFRWGGLDKVETADDIYLDETIRRMVATHRSTLLDLATGFYNEAVGIEMAIEENPALAADTVRAREAYDKAVNVLETMTTKLPTVASPYSIQLGRNVADVYMRIGTLTENTALFDKGVDILESEIRRYAQYVRYAQSLTPSQYASLQRNDRYIDQTYFLELLRDYHSNGLDLEAMVDEIEAMGVNIGNMIPKK